MAAVFFLLLLAALTNSAVTNQTCTGSGKFVADYNCTSYAVCLEIGVGTYASYNIACPAGFIVRHTDMVCSKPGDICITSYNCTATGNFTNPSSANASSYISCTQGLGNMIIAIEEDCPLNYKFNNTLRVCEQGAITSTQSPISVTELPILTTQIVPAETTQNTSPSITSSPGTTVTTTQKITPKSTSAANTNSKCSFIISSLFLFVILST